MKTGGRVVILAWLLISLSFNLGNVSLTPAREKGAVFSSLEGFEADKCASIWLIKRFIDTDATFRFSPKDEDLAEGIPFDTPEAELRRYHNLSTFEFILKHYHLNDPKLIHLGTIIHDIEINIWGRKRFEESLVIRDAVNQIIQNSTSPSEVIEKTLRYFDVLYEEMKL